MNSAYLVLVSPIWEQTFEAEGGRKVAAKSDDGKGRTRRRSVLRGGHLADLVRDGVQHRVEDDGRVNAAHAVPRWKY